MATSFDAAYYSWSRKFGVKTPWARHSGSMFEPHERRMFQNASDWLATFGAEGSMDELEGYVVPLARTPSARGPLEVQLGRAIHFFGVSPLRGGEPLPLLFALPKDDARPADGQLIRVWLAKRIMVWHEVKQHGEFVALVEGWNELEADAPYLQVSPRGQAIFDMLGIKTEPRNIQKRFADMLGDEELGLMLSSPVVSSPPSTDVPGGVTFTSHATRDAVSETILGALQLVLPHPYRSLAPPAIAIKGKQHDDGRGHVFLLADRPIESLHTVDALLSADREELLRRAAKRDHLPGERSLTASWILQRGDPGSSYNRMLVEFNRFDITLGEDLSERAGGYVDPRRIEELLDDEDLPVEIAHARHRHPMQPSTAAIPRAHLRLDIEARLDEAPESFRTDLLLGTLTTGAMNAIHRTATSFARDQGATSVTPAHWRSARATLLVNLETLMSRADIRSLATRATRDERFQKDEGFHLVRNALLAGPMSYLDLWAALGNTRRFPDPTTLQDFLQLLRDHNYVHFDRKKNYCWSA